jgi:branched-chain amino acid aminotransferase
MEIRIEKTKKSHLSEVDFGNLPFGKIKSDHMFVVDYSEGQWHDARIVPFAPMLLSPATSALHYGQAIFEGLKSHINAQDVPLLFRPDQNLKRLNLSAERMCMPTLPEDIFMAGLKELIRIDKQWIPRDPGKSLYIRPFMFATDDSVGVRVSETYTFVIFTSPVSPYYSQPLKIKVADKYVRAFDGGVGAAKAAGNYGASMLPTKEAFSQGYHQVMWMDGHEYRYVEETGTTNVFFVVGDQVITPALDGNILDGVTRKSCIQLLKESGMTVEEKRVDINELLDAHQKGILSDAFCTGTAATVAHIQLFNYKGKDIVLPPVSERKWSNYLSKKLDDIKWGIEPDAYGWIVEVNGKGTAVLGT